MRRPFASVIKQCRKIGWPEFVVLLAIGSLTASLWIFVTVTDEVIESEHRAIDKRVMLAFRTPGDLARPIGPEWVKRVSLEISAMGSAPVLTIIVLLICGYLFLEKNPAAAWTILFASVSGTILNQILKNLIGRERPQIVPHLSEISNSSFPSGHSMLSAIIYLTVATLLTKTVHTRAAKIYLIGSAFVLAFLVGLTRVIIGVHYPTDVVAGWMAGTAWAIICWFLAGWFSRRGQLLSKGVAT